MVCFYEWKSCICSQIKIQSFCIPKHANLLTYLYQITKLFFQESHQFVSTKASNIFIFGSTKNATACLKFLHAAVKMNCYWLISVKSKNKQAYFLIRLNCYPNAVSNILPYFEHFKYLLILSHSHYWVLLMYRKCCIATFNNMYFLKFVFTHKTGLQHS